MIEGARERRGYGGLDSGRGMRYGLGVPGDIGDEFDEDNEGAEEKEDAPEQAQAKESQGQYSGGLAGAIKERPLA